MPLFIRKRRILESIDNFKQDVAAVQEDLEGFKKAVEKDLAGIRKDFRDLVMFLQDGAENEEGAPSPAQEDAAAPDDPSEPNRISLTDLKIDLGELTRRVETIGQCAEDLHRDVEAVKTALGEEMKSIRESLADAKRDIGNKITYAVARLRT